MKFQLIINKEKEESVVVTAHAPSPLTDKLEALVQGCASQDRIAAWWEDELLYLPVGDIACITVQDGKTYAIDSRNPAAIGIFTAIFAGGFTLIWLGIYLSIKAKTDRINRALKKRQSPPLTLPAK